LAASSLLALSWQHDDLAAAAGGEIDEELVVDAVGEEVYAGVGHEEMAAAVEFARDSPFPDPGDAFEDLYA
jgi:hypothetical protein